MQADIEQLRDSMEKQRAKYEEILQEKETEIELVNASKLQEQIEARKAAE